MVKVPFTLLHPVPPVSAQFPMITPVLRVLLVVFNVPVTEVLVSVSVLPPDVTVKVNVPVTWFAEL
jgi:hypothetical protein